jgi:hypothetical protein
MSGVVLRCANCGTTQDSAGECQACHEQQVQFYCTRHTPGLWLKTPVCAQCGAQFGKDDSPPPRRPSASPPPRTTGLPRRPDIPEASPRPRPDPWGRRASRSPDPEPPRMDSRETIERLMREYFRRRAPPPEDIELTRAPMVAGGCLRIVLLVFLLMMVAMYILASFSSMFYIY